MNRTRWHAAIAVLWVAVIVALLGLGTWQVQRRSWKLDLIARVGAGLKAVPVAAPATAGPGDAYRQVFVVGSYMPGRDSFVQASTVHGPGWWVLTPMAVDDGRVVLINRGYVAQRQTTATRSGRVTVHGLLRLSEPGGGFLRNNDATADRWYSRDIAAIAARRGLSKVLPYFVDADASGNAAGQPVGGLTVISFPNNHLVYAITWYIMAIMAAVGFLFSIKIARRDDKHADQSGST